jgi:hypothetical protein
MLRHPFTDFVLSYLARNDLNPVGFLEASLARLLRINAGLTDALAQGLHEEPESFWSRFVDASRADANAYLAGPIDISSLRAGRKPSKEVLKKLHRILRDAGLSAERPDATTVTLFHDIGPLSVRHFYDSGNSGFTMWTAIAFPGDRIPSFIASYAGSIGVMVRTTVGLPDAEAIDFAIRLALEWQASFEQMLRIWAAGEESPNPSLQRTPPG